MQIPRTKLLVAALATGLSLAGLVAAQSRPTPAQQQELDAARAELDRAAERYAELARRYAPEDGPYRIQKQMLHKPVVGVLLAPDAKAGVRIAGVTPDGAAAAAGIRSGDTLLSVDGKALQGADGEARLAHARRLLGELDGKRAVRLGYARDGRDAVASVTPRAGDRLFVLSGLEGVRAFDEAEFGRMADNVDWVGLDKEMAKVRAIDLEGLDEELGREMAIAIAPEIRREVLRIKPGELCEGERCKVPVIAEALRWSGLNLASLDDELGRYFGTDQGVLVLSTGPELEGLQAGDVIRKVDGRSVDSPREAMEALRARPAGSRVAVEYLRERKPATAQVTVPKALPLRIPAPPAPPAPPAAPKAVVPPPPPAPPAPPPATGSLVPGADFPIAMAPPAPPAPPAPLPVPERFQVY